jgi:hypothetical protein
MDTNKKNARIAGVLYLVIFVANLFVFFAVSGSLGVPGDATATANNIAASEPLYRIGIVSYLAVFLSDLGVAVLMYLLLKPVSKSLAMIAMVARLLQTAVHGVNLLNFVFPLVLLTGENYLSAFTTDQINALVLVFHNAHYFGVLISEAFFALSTVVLGYLVFKSEFFPGILGILLAIAGLGYFLDSLGVFLMPQYQDAIGQIIFVPAIIGELSFTFWLLIKGVREQEAISLEPVTA